MLCVLPGLSYDWEGEKRRAKIINRMRKTFTDGETHHLFVYVVVGLLICGFLLIALDLAFDK